MTGLMLVGLIPFAALGIALGHVLTPDSIGPALGGGGLAAGAPRRHLVPARTALPARHRRSYLPSYWLVQASHVALGGQPVAGDGVARDRRLDGRAERARGCAPTGATPGGCSG